MKEEQCSRATAPPEKSEGEPRCSHLANDKRGSSRGKEWERKVQDPLGPPLRHRQESIPGQWVKVSDGYPGSIHTLDGAQGLDTPGCPE